MLLDADVLIDYFGSNFSVLSDVRQNIGEIFTTTKVFEEVGGLDIQVCQQVGLEI